MNRPPLRSSTNSPGGGHRLPLPKQDPCYLCEIVAGREAWNIVERASLTVTALNGRQFEVGQCLVFPQRHAPTLLDLSDSEGAAVMRAAQRAARAMVGAFRVDGVLLYQNNGVGSGQEVPHFHLHVVPRRAGSDWGLGPPHLARLAAEGPPPQLDYSVATDEKLEAAATLKRFLE